MEQFNSEIEIDAPAQRVWDVLTDFSSFPERNPCMPSITGEPSLGAKLTVRLTPPSGMGMTFKPTVLRSEPGRELRWCGCLMLPGLFDGGHYFIIEPVGDTKSRLTHRESLKGVPVTVLGVTGIYKNTLRGFDEMNRVLKARVESG